MKTSSEKMSGETGEVLISAEGYRKPGRDVDEAQVEVCRAWLRAHARPTKTIRSKHSSYGYKHMVEVWSRSTGRDAYVSNGAFIVAALREGYRVQPDPRGSPNVDFNMTTGEPRRSRLPDVSIVDAERRLLAAFWHRYGVARTAKMLGASVDTVDRFAGSIGVAGRVAERLRARLCAVAADVIEGSER